MHQNQSLEQDIYEYEADELVSTQLEVTVWPKKVATIVIIVMPIMITLFARGHSWVVAMLAFVNCILYMFFAVHFLKKKTLTSLIPVVVPLWIIVGSCIGVIYFAIFNPFGTYETRGGSIRYLAGGVRYQLVIFCFLLVYFISMARFLRKDSLVIQKPSMCSAHVGIMAMVIIVPILLSSAISLILDIPLSLKLWTARLFIYYRSLLFVTGVVITRIPKLLKIFLGVFLGIILVLFSIQGGRAMALVSIASFLIGMFFFSEIKKHTKVVLVAIVLFGFPWFMVIGFTVRALLGGGRGVRGASLITKWTALKDWGEVAKQIHTFDLLFGRMFFTAGNVIVAYTPSSYPYRRFSPTKYFKEFGILMLPQPLIRRFLGVEHGKLGFVLKTDYTGTVLLNEYNMAVTETSSIETSIIGHFWMLGGYVFVLAGGFVMALLHGFVAWFIRRVWIRDPDKAVFYFGVLFYTILWGVNWDLIQMTRFMFLTYIFAFVGYKLIKPFLIIRGSAEQSYDDHILTSDTEEYY